MIFQIQAYDILAKGLKILAIGKSFIFYLFIINFFFFEHIHVNSFLVNYVSFNSV